MDRATQVDKAKSHIIVEIIENLTNSVVCKTIIRKITGNIKASSFDAGEEMVEKIAPFDN
jgi:hypothetical protein